MRCLLPCYGFPRRQTNQGRCSILPRGSGSCNSLFLSCPLSHSASLPPFLSPSFLPASLLSSLPFPKNRQDLSRVVLTLVHAGRHEEELRRLTARIREQETRINELESHCLNLSLRPEWAEDISGEGGGVASGIEREAALTGQVQRLAAVNVGSLSQGSCTTPLDALFKIGAYPCLPHPTSHILPGEERRCQS